jgi:hypothetical protein
LQDFSLPEPLSGRQLDDFNLFVAGQFYSQLREPLALINSHASDRRGDILRLTAGEPALTRLGFALIELALGKRLASLQGHFANVSGDPYYRDLAIAAAIMTSGSLKQEEGQRYHQAVLTCLKQEIPTQDGYGRKSLSFTDPSFQRDAEGAILKPLVSLWAQDFGRRSEQTV